MITRKCFRILDFDLCFKKKKKRGSPLEPKDFTRIILCDIP